MPLVQRAPAPLAFATLAILIAAPGQAQEGEHDDSGPRWLEREIQLQLGGVEALPLAEFALGVEEGAAAWEETPAPRFVISAQPARQTQVALDGVNSVYFTLDWIGEPNQVALTFTHHRDGEILEMDMALNARDYTFTVDPALQPDAFDLSNLLAHELGHGIGIDHLGNEDATMFPGIQPGEVQKRDLAEADLEAAERLYATWPEEDEDPFQHELDCAECEELVGGCDASGPAEHAWAAALLGLAFVRRRGRGRSL